MKKKCLACGSESVAEGSLGYEPGGATYASFYINPQTWWRGITGASVVLKGFICLKCGFANLYADPEKVKSKMHKD